jgi:hypothetical protein
MTQALKVVSSVIDPDADLDIQIAQLDYLIHNPPYAAPRMTLSLPMLNYINDRLNGVNREKKPKVIKEIMDEGYIFIGGTIGFGNSGLLRDGQNRVQACINLEQAMDTFISFGVPDKHFALIDSGKKRDLADACKIDGIGGPSHWKEAASALRWVMNLQDTFDTGVFTKRYRTTVSGVRYYHNKINAQMFQICVTNAAKCNRKIQPGYLAAVLYHFWINEKGVLATEFCRSLEKSRGGLGNKLAKQIGWNEKGGKRVEPDFQIAWIIQAVKGKKPEWARGNPFPSIV